MSRMLVIVAALVLGLAPVVAQGPTRTEMPVPDLPGYRTLKADFHLHTVFSDGNVWPTVHVMEAWRDGLDVIALTEHAEYHPHEKDVNTDRGRSYEIARPLAERLGLVLVPGVEITKPDPYTAPPVLEEGSQHFNALFVTDFNALTTPDLFEALRRARAQEAFVFWNHPGFRAEPRWFPPVARAHAEGLFQGMELVNGPDFYEPAYPWIEEHGLTIIANSDAHDPVPPRATGMRRPITLVFARSADVEGVREALFARRTAAWLGDDVWGAEEQLRGLFEGAVTVEQPTSARSRSPMLLVRNSSAIPMHVRLRNTPAWLRMPEAHLPPEQTTLLRLTALPGAPAGRQEVTLELEVLNLHVGPGRPLQALWSIVVEAR